MFPLPDAGHCSDPGDGAHVCKTGCMLLSCPGSGGLQFLLVCVINRNALRILLNKNVASLLQPVTPSQSVKVSPPTLPHHEAFLTYSVSPMLAS